MRKPKKTTKKHLSRHLKGQWPLRPIQRNHTTKKQEEGEMLSSTQWLYLYLNLYRL